MRKKAIPMLAIVAVVSLAVWEIVNALPTGKPGATPTISESAATRSQPKSWGPYERPTFRHTFAKGAAANTSIYTPGIVINSDQILDVWYCDTTSAKIASGWSSVTDSTYVTATDSTKCGLTTAGGYIMVFWYDAP